MNTMNSRPLLAVLTVSLLAACQQQIPQEEADVAADAPSVEGAWNLVGMETVSADGEVTEVPTYENLMLFKDGYYSMALSRGDHRSPFFSERWGATEEEQLDRWSLIIVNSGTYEMTESELITRPLFALVPEFVGGVARYGYEVTEDQLILTVTGIVSADGADNPYFIDGSTWVYRMERID
jgi:hypothetical protein